MELVTAMTVSHLRRYADKGWVLEGIPLTAKMARSLLDKGSVFKPDCCVVLDLSEVMTLCVRVEVDMAFTANFPAELSSHFGAFHAWMHFTPTCQAQRKLIPRKACVCRVSCFQGLGMGTC